MSDNLFAPPTPTATDPERLAAFGRALAHADFVALSPAEGGGYTPFPLLIVVSDDFEDGALVYTLAKGSPTHA